MLQDGGGPCELQPVHTGCHFPFLQPDREWVSGASVQLVVSRHLIYVSRSLHQGVTPSVWQKTFTRNQGCWNLTLVLPSPALPAFLYLNSGCTPLPPRVMLGCKSDKAPDMCVENSTALCKWKSSEIIITIILHWLSMPGGMRRKPQESQESGIKVSSWEKRSPQ